MKSKWTVKDIPDQNGRVYVVTGANSGIGYEAALALAGKGAEVILAVRNMAKGDEALGAMRAALPNARVSVLALDLANLASVRQFSKTFMGQFDSLDGLINNAGVMFLPFRRTVDGFEMQFGTNHLGHFALTGLLLPAILAAPAGRVVTVSSGYHAPGRIDFENLNGEQKYHRYRAYSQSKLANLLFAYELQRRFSASGVEALSVACHPGYAATNLQVAGARMEGSYMREKMMLLGNRLLAQSSAMGALPTLYAATSPEVRGGEYIGPDAFGGLRGHPTTTRSSARSYNVDVARQLWEVSERLTGVRFELPERTVGRG